MTDPLDRNLTNCDVVLRREFYPASDEMWDDENSRTAFVTGGHGANPRIPTGGLLVRDNDGRSFQVDRNKVERFVREVPKNEREITYVVTVMSENGVEAHEVSALTTLRAISKTLELRGWGSLPHKVGMNHDAALVEINGVEYSLTPMRKRQNRNR
jgi:hypothetical protein